MLAHKFFEAYNQSELGQEKNRHKNLTIKVRFYDALRMYVREEFLYYYSIKPVFLLKVHSLTSMYLFQVRKKGFGHLPKFLSECTKYPEMFFL